MSVVEIENVRVRFGTVIAVGGVTVSFPEGRLTGLIGPNGAGKTTLIDALTGFVPATGTVRFDGRDISRLPAATRARLGLARTWQSVELFDDLTVLENLEAGTRQQGVLDVVRCLVWPPVRRLASATMSTLEQLGIDHLASRRPDELSYGDRKRVGIARALTLQPRFLLLDEPAAGLDTHESRELGTRLREIAAAGVGLLLVDHDMSLVMGSCDHVHVMRAGELLAQGTPREVRCNEAVLAAYLGAQTAPESGGVEMSAVGPAGSADA